MYLYLLAFPFVSEPVFAVCTNPVPLGNRGPVHGKLIREKISKASRIWKKKIRPSVQTSHLTSNRGVESRENRRSGRNKGLLVGNKRGLRALQRKCLHFRDSEGSLNNQVLCSFISQIPSE